MRTLTFYRYNVNSCFIFDLLKNFLQFADGELRRRSAPEIYRFDDFARRKFALACCQFPTNGIDIARPKIASGSRVERTIRTSRRTKRDMNVYSCHSLLCRGRKITKMFLCSSTFWGNLLAVRGIFVNLGGIINTHIINLKISPYESLSDERNQEHCAHR